MSALDRLGVADLGDRMPDTLSYGLRKRVALARAVAARPRLVLLDEPASGLPENELSELGDLIRELAAEAGVVVIEHRMDLVMSVCDTIFVLDFGKLIASGSPAQVQANPAVTAAYLGAEGQDPAEARAGSRPAPPDPSTPPDPPRPIDPAGLDDPSTPPDPPTRQAHQPRRTANHQPHQTCQAHRLRQTRRDPSSPPDSPTLEPHQPQQTQQLKTGR